MAPQGMHATLMAIKPPTPPAQDFLIEVQCEDEEEEPPYERVVAALRKMCNKSDDAQIAIGIDASTILAAQGGTPSAGESSIRLMKVLNKYLQANGLVLYVEFEASGRYKMDPEGFRLDTHPTGGQETCNKRCLGAIVGDVTASPVVRKHALHLAGKLLAGRQGPTVMQPKPAEFALGEKVGVSSTFQGPRGPVQLRIDASQSSDFEALVASPFNIFPCHDNEDDEEGGRAKSYGVVCRDGACKAMGCEDKWGLAFLCALNPEHDDATGFPKITDLFKAEFLRPRRRRDYAPEEFNLSIAGGIGSLIRDATINTDDAFGPGDCDVGHVAKAFKQKVEARPGRRSFPADATPMSDERASANHLVRVLAGLSSDAQRERVWRRFKNYEKYLA